MVVNARTMCSHSEVIAGAAVAASDWHPCAINSKSPVPMFRALWFSSAWAYSVRLREEIRRPAAGCGYVGVVVAFISRRVTECRFHRVLLLLLGNDLLQGKIGIDLVCVLQSAQLQEQGLVNALQFGHVGLLRRVLGLSCGFQVRYVALPCGLVGADGAERLQVIAHH